MSESFNESVCKWVTVLSYCYILHMISSNALLLVVRSSDVFNVLQAIVLYNIEMQRGANESVELGVDQSNKEEEKLELFRDDSDQRCKHQWEKTAELLKNKSEPVSHGLWGTQELLQFARWRAGTTLTTEFHT